jgi:hypothetical protein
MFPPRKSCPCWFDWKIPTALISHIQSVAASPEQHLEVQLVGYPNATEKRRHLRLHPSHPRLLLAGAVRRHINEMVENSSENI